MKLDEVLNVVGDAIGVDFSGIPEVVSDPHQDTLDDCLGAISDACNQKRQEISEVPSAVHGEGEAPEDEHDLAKKARVAIKNVNRLIEQLARMGVTVEVNEHEIVHFGVGNYPSLSLRTFKTTEIS